MVYDALNKIIIIFYGTYKICSMWLDETQTTNGTPINFMYPIAPN